MNYDVVEMMQENGTHLLGLQLVHYKLDQFNQIKRYLATPFTNTRSKQYQQDINQFIKSMKMGKIYHYRNHFEVNFLMFKRDSDQSILIIGPFLERRPSERECHERLQEVGLQVSKILLLKQYLLRIPLVPYKKSLNFCRLSTKFITGKKKLFDVETVAFKFHRGELFSEEKQQYEYSLAQVEERYNIENQMLIAVEKGDVETALKLVVELQILISGIQRSKTDISNERYKVRLLNTLCRKAVEKAGVNVLSIDAISSKYAAIIDDAMDALSIRNIAEELVIAYAELANKAIALNYSPKVSKSIQYIEINLDKALTLNELAENVNLSPAYLSQIFNEEVRVSITQYINDLRVEKATELLKRTSLSIKKIGEYVGFQSQSYFTQCFKKTIGLTPLQFRKQIAK